MRIRLLTQGPTLTACNMVNARLGTRRACAYL